MERFLLITFVLIGCTHTEPVLDTEPQGVMVVCPEPTLRGAILPGTTNPIQELVVTTAKTFCVERGSCARSITYDKSINHYSVICADPISYTKGK